MAHSMTAPVTRDGRVLPLDNPYTLSRLRKRHPARVWQRFKHHLGFETPKPQYGIIIGFRSDYRYSIPVRIARTLAPFLVPERTDVPWYSPASRNDMIHSQLFRDYMKRQGHETETKMAEEIDRIDHIRERAWQLGTYPCIGRFWFIRSIFATTPYYAQILDRVKDGAVLLDLACGMGQELRRLREDGAKGKMYAMDIEKKMWRLGLELFRDAKNPPAEFVHSTATGRGREKTMKHFATRIDIILMCQFLDLFSWYSQEFFLTMLMSISKIGTSVTGWTLGTTRYEAGEYKYEESRGERFLHCPLTFKILWENVAQRTNTKWRIESSLLELVDLGFESDDFSRIKAPKLRALCFHATREI